MIDYSIEIINNPAKLVNLVERLTAVSVFAVDIETVDWWNRHQERIALIQIAFRTERGVKVSVIDALSEIDLQTLRIPLESNSTTKIIHNAAFDATRLFNHYKFKVAPIHDTMLAARRNREKKCSLQTQAATHLNLHLDKRAQRSNWSRRPLDLKQIDYAAQDAYAALRLYELQTERNLDGLYRQKAPSSSIQEPLPLNNSLESVNATPNPDVLERQTDSLQANNASTFDLSTSSTAVLGIVSELPTRYGTEQLSVSVGKDRVGLAGWIIDSMIGKEADFDEGTARLVIADLLDRKLIKLTETQRLEATPKGINMWNQLKTTS
jgi:hypothetical protein